MFPENDDGPRPDNGYAPPVTRSATITGVGSSLPPRLGPNTWFEDKVETTDEWIRERTGIEARHFVTDGGRVLNVTGIRATPGEAQDRAYAAAERIQFDGKQMRTDIAARAVDRVEA